MAFVDLGELAYNGICCGGTPVTNGTVETSGFNFAFVGSIPLNPSFSLFGKLGMFFWEAQASDLTGGFPFTQTIDDVDISYGSGASYQFNRNLGVQVEMLQPRPGLPDLVFTANAGMIVKNVFLSSRFKHDVRAKESPIFDEWFASHGFTVEHLPAGMFHEGAGDALFCGDVLFAGYRQRSDAAAHLRRPAPRRG